MWFNLNCVEINEFIITNNFLSNDIPNINDAIFTLISTVIKEDVLSVVFSLVNVEKFAHFSVVVVSLPVFVIL